jgi:hypothetical protein
VHFKRYRHHFLVQYEFEDVKVSDILAFFQLDKIFLATHSSSTTFHRQTPVSAIDNRTKTRQTSAYLTSHTMITFQSSTKTKSRESTTAGNSSVSSNKKKSPKLSLKQALGQIRGPRRRRRASSIDTETTESEEPWPWTPSVMEFLTDICPEDILPKILAFAGPQKTAALSKVNSAWRDVIAEDSTWRVLCEDLYKVRFLSIIASFPSFQIFS